MKTIDTKSLLLGVTLSVLFLSLTSGKTSADNNDLQFFVTAGGLNVFNKQTNTIYEYQCSIYGQIKDKPPVNIYKVGADGSSITQTK